MKKVLLQTISLILTLLMVLAISSCSKGLESLPAPEYVNVTYTTNTGGYISGNNLQKIEKGSNTELVTAIPNTGYKFVKWSDGNTEITRRDYGVSEDVTFTAEFKIFTYSLRYISGEHGSIQGSTEQTVDYDKNGTKVVAVADTGYDFLGWSDGVQTAERTDKNIKADLLVTANFTPYSKTYALNYNFGETEENIEAVTLTYGSYDNTVFPVPQREHFTFEGWYNGDMQVADKDGHRLLDNNDILSLEKTEIYAKWTANETFTYKILLVYVTKIDATLPTGDKTSTMHVDYTMSELEREFCHLTTIQLKRYMDKLTDGLVVFEIDEYFTKDTVLTESFRQGRVATGICNSLFPNNIEEVSEILDDYDSVLSVFSMDDLDYKLHDGSGAAIAKYGEVNLDSFFNTLKIYKTSLQTAVNALRDGSDINLKDVGLPNSYLLYEYWFSIFTHELAHTIEQRVNLYSYHKTVVGELHGNQHYKPMAADKFYYLNEAVMEGKKVGIPYKFWKGDIARVKYNVTEAKDYGCQGSAYIERYNTGVQEPIGSGNFSYDIIIGETVTAIAAPYPGYRFVCWSDGVMSIERTDFIIKDFEVTAIFEPIDYELTIAKTLGGKILDSKRDEINGVLNLEYGGEYIHFMAVAEEGYRFVGWSDGVTDAQRSFAVRLGNLNIFNSDNKYTLTAIFEKIEENKKSEL